MMVLQTMQIRTSLRVLFDVPDHIGEELNKRIHPHLPEKLTIDGVVWCRQELGGKFSCRTTFCRTLSNLLGGKAGGPLNKRWRFNKYSAVYSCVVTPTIHRANFLSHTTMLATFMTRTSKLS